ncbi:hypothetical protein Nepgr_008895 [Nepenthes gracilis]|uniref:Uncharacterized protein n=1 Tax=Nepenthes gracilis TaxID=150966 RepID=A0AAD3S9I0_NEPGR|nr:hypothetical protein Nepgr_008895 [Nepenthes gracilis]
MAGVVMPGLGAEDWPKCKLKKPECCQTEAGQVEAGQGRPIKRDRSAGHGDRPGKLPCVVRPGCFCVWPTWMWC